MVSFAIALILSPFGLEAALAGFPCPKAKKRLTSRQPGSSRALLNDFT
jgi:hypothetical protein